MIIDLSVTLNEQTPVYPGDPKTKIETAGVLERDGYCDHYVSVGTHVGTHVDAPAHMVKGGRTLADIPIEHFVGRGKLISVQNKKFDLSVVKDTNIQAGDIVLFYTGMSRAYYKPEYYGDYPAIPDGVAEYLVGQKVKMVGVDMCSVDHAPFPVHRILLSGGVLIIENLTNLEKLIGKDFEVSALPVKLEIDGAPARVIARVND